MNKILITLIIFSSAILSNCTPARITGISYDKNSTVTEKVQIHREKKLTYMGVQTIFGYNNQDKVKLKNGQKFEILVPVGEQEFFIRTNQADRPNKKTFILKKGEPLCLKTYPAQGNFFKAMMFGPLLFWFTNAFELKKAENCIN